MELSISGVELSSFRVLRLLRTLRPLRLISHNISMKIVVTALLESVVAIMNVGIVLLLVWLMFAILGVDLFAGKFYSCEIESIETKDKCEEYGYDWTNKEHNFDNVFEAMLTLFVVVSQEAWPDIMYSA